jgi:hypothetical protein
MRYVVAMVSAAGFALVATLFLSQHVAGWIVRQYTFESPDGVNDLHSSGYMATSIAALIAGWIFGWVMSGWLEGSPQRRR